MFDDLKQTSATNTSSTTPVTTPRVDSQPISKTTTVANTPPISSKVDDMFSDVDPKPIQNGSVDNNKPSAVQSGKIKPVSQTNIPVSETSSPSPVPQRMTTPNIPSVDNMIVSDDRGSGGTIRKIIIAILVIILLVIVGGGAYYLYLRNNKIAAIVNENNNQNINININDNINNNQNTEPVIKNEDDLDDDFDGLSNGLEKIYGTNPLEPDTDNDGVFDQDEIELYKTDPLVADSDNDGLDDHAEIITYGTDPNDPDTDGDGYKDGDEILNGYNPLGVGKLSTEGNNINGKQNTNENL